MEKYRILSRDVIKYMAVAAMVCNHFANCFLRPGTAFYLLLIWIGNFTAVTMCYFLVEGYHYTHSKKRYAGRLFIFALLSQIPFCLAFSKGKHLEFVSFNMIFTLLFCFLILAAKEYIQERNRKILVIFALFMACAYSDWSVLAPLFVLVFERTRGSKRNTAVGFGIGAAADFLSVLAEGISSQGWSAPGKMVLYGLADCAGILVSGLVLLFLYNGKKGKSAGQFSKWFFYIFYPLHLLVFGLLRVSLL